MSRVVGYIVALAFAVALTGTLATVAVAQRTAPVQPPAMYPTAWEYARFPYSPLQTDWSWRSGADQIAGDASKVYHSLGGRPRPVVGDVWYGEVLSVAGQQGWEVMLMQDYKTGSEVWFKRPAAR